MTPSLVSNPSNLILGQKHVQLRGAQRFTLGTLCDPGTHQPSRATPHRLRRELKTVSFTFGLGENILIPAIAGIKKIMELYVWVQNANASILIYQGTGNNIVPWINVPFTAAASNPIQLPFAGNWEMSHFDVDNNQQLTMFLGAVGPVNGFLRYRVANGNPLYTD